MAIQLTIKPAEGAQSPLLIVVDGGWFGADDDVIGAESRRWAHEATAGTYGDVGRQGGGRWEGVWAARGRKAAGRRLMVTKNGRFDNPRCTAFRTT